MASRFNTLLHGELNDVDALVDAGCLDEGEVRAVLQNLIGRVRRLEKKAAASPPTGDAARRLADAAPDLLAACRAMLSSPTSGDTPSEEAVEQARAAIAKATGDTP